MDAAQALADLTEISSQIEAAVLFRAPGEIEGSTLADEEAARALVRGATGLLEDAAGLRSAEVAVTQLEASTHAGSVFVVRDGPLGIVATTAARPTSGLVFYDLKSCLRGAGETAGRPKRKRAATATGESGKDSGDEA